MTTVHPRQVDASTVIDGAHRQALDAASRAGVTIDLVEDLAGLEAVETLVNRTWENPTSEISLGMLRAFSKSGNFVSGAYTDGTLVGACVAFVGGGTDAYLHSHLAAVSADHRARGIGFALKLHQRAWALGRGIASVSWTYDPLVRRNARLNLGRLGASPVEYLPDFYGTRADQLNANLPTDRLLVVWELRAPETARACARANARLRADDLVRDGGCVLLSPDRSQEPVVSTDVGGRYLLVGLPEDITDLRRRRPEVAEQWRTAVRTSLGRALDEGTPVVGFTEEGHYVIDRSAGGVRGRTGAW